MSCQCKGFHLFDCPQAGKCQQCGVRTDVEKVCHLFDCPHTKKCLQCGMRTDLNFYCACARKKIKEGKETSRYSALLCAQNPNDLIAALQKVSLNTKKTELIAVAKNKRQENPAIWTKAVAKVFGKLIKKL